MSTSNALVPSSEHKIQDETPIIAKTLNNKVMEIGIRMRVDELEEISTTQQKYVIKGVFDKDWPATEKDKENWAKFLDPSNLEVTEYIPEDNPEVGFANCCECPTYTSVVWSETKSQFRISPLSGRNQSRYDIRSVWTEEFEVESFPFDVQDLTMVFASEHLPVYKAKMQESASRGASLSIDRSWSPITQFDIDNVAIDFEDVDYG
eukprot:545884_1